MEQIKNIIFDVGDVLLSYRWKYMLMDYGLSEEEAVRIGTEMFDDPEGLWGLLDLGTVPQQEIIDHYCRKYPADEKVIRCSVHYRKCRKLWGDCGIVREFHGCRLSNNRRAESVRSPETFVAEYFRYAARDREHDSSWEQ